MVRPMASIRSGSHSRARLKLAAAHWERALDEWNKTVAAEVDPSDVSQVAKKLEAAKVNLAQQAAPVRK